MVVTKNLKAGSHIITFSAPGYDTLRAEILVSSSGVTCIKVEAGGSCGSTTPPGVNMTGVWSVFGTLKPIAAPPPPETGYLSVTSTPSGAAVAVNSVPIGSTPITAHELPVGTPTVTLSQSGYVPVSQPATITAGDTTPITVPLTPIPEENKGALSVASSPSGATVSVDGIGIGTTPVSAYDLTTGVKSVSIALAGYETATQSVTVVAGETNDMGTVTLTEEAPPTTIGGWIDEISVTSVNIDHAMYVYNLTIGASGAADALYDTLSPKPSRMDPLLATLDNAMGLYNYSIGAMAAGNALTGCNY